MACEVGDGAGAGRDHGDRGRMSRAWRGGWPGRPRAEARRSEATHSDAPGPDGLGTGGCGGRAASLVRRLWTSLASKGYYRATFRSLFGDVPVRVRRLLVCPCQGPGEAKSFAALDLGKDAVAPELAALVAAGVRTDTPATVLCDGDAGLWRLQREGLPGAMIVLDWWHAAVRFEHARQAARGLGAGTAETCLADAAVRTLDRAKWCLWHGRWTGCRRKLAALRRW